MLKKDAIYLTDTEAGFPWLHQCRFAASCFLAETVEETGVVRLTKASDPSDYARCFHVFLAHTLKQPQPLPSARLAVDIREAVRKQRQQRSDSFRQKPFRQLLTFSLSALKVLGRLREDPLEDLVEEQLLDYMTKKLAAVDCIRLIGTATNKASVQSFLVDDIHPHDLGTILDHQGVAIRTGHHCAMPVMDFFGVPGTARASLALYNNNDDIDRLVAAIDKARQIFA